MKRFLSGDEAFAEGIRLARPQVISAYPITPQTIVVERLSEMVEDGSLKAEYVHVESEHSALACAIGASATGARTFTATSSQGLLYMTECLTYASGGRFPIVMMNASRSTALPWNIFGDQRDSLALLDHGWIQAYAQDNQEALDMALMAYAIAEDKAVRTPVMVNLDGFAVTHTYENVEIPTQEEADAFLPTYDATGNQFDFKNPVNMGYSAGPAVNRYYKAAEHEGMLAAGKVVGEVEARFAKAFGRNYPGLVETYHCEDAELVLITLGSIAGLARQRVAELRSSGIKAGLVRLRYVRPFPAAEIVAALASAKAIGVLEKDISFGAEGTIMTNVCSALQAAGNTVPVFNFVGGLGGDDITHSQMAGIFEALSLKAHGAKIVLPRVSFLGVDSPADELGEAAIVGTVPANSASSDAASCDAVADATLQKGGEA